MANQMLMTLFQEEVVMNNKENYLLLLKRQVSLYLADVASSREHSMQLFIEVNNETDPMLKQARFNDMDSAQAIQIMWAAVGKVWLKISQPVFMAQLWGLENLKMRTLTASEYAQDMTRLQEIQDFANITFKDECQMLKNSVKVMICSVKSVVHFAGNNLQRAIEEAKAIWQDFKNDWLMQKYFPGALCSLHDNCFIAIYAGDVQFFEECMLYYINFAKTWPIANMVIKALLKQAKSVSLPYSSTLDPIIDALEDTQWPCFSNMKKEQHNETDGEVEFLPLPDNTFNLDAFNNGVLQLPISDDILTLPPQQMPETLSPGLDMSDIVLETPSPNSMFSPVASDETNPFFNDQMFVL
eukprot:CAMPEP_0168523686 /NCGR_PEP_ID=MMETSP0405-20121227/10144_1 /TAXON_ID=498012 /ORGANISM="Trichosphaerium sp, Strain Am-I-7 wt" /LENGTH=354 /DNA_ID=CAMNT_0008545633 /DNA_START=277 /DNA_END=1342 /DNA_ORIENTATION=-